MLKQVESEIDIIAQRKQNILFQGFTFLQNIKIQDVACNHFAAHFLSEDGLVYTIGKDVKKYGILGLGSVYELNEPQLNPNLQDLRISKLSIGLSHCCALTTSGQLYTWGTGLNGQLCHQQDDTMFSNVPKLVQSSKNMNIAQLYSSSYYTLIINSKGKLSMFGTLKGFAKFLFESPTKEASKYHSGSSETTADLGLHNSSSDQSSLVISDRVVKKHKLILPRGEKITKVTLSEKSFCVYCSETKNFYFVNECFQPELVLNRDLKSFQFLCKQKYLIAHDTTQIMETLKYQRNNNLILEFDSMTKSHTDRSVYQTPNDRQFFSQDLPVIDETPQQKQFSQQYASQSQKTENEFADSQRITPKSLRQLY